MNLLRHPLVALAMATLITGQDIPYNPSRILLSRNSSIAYILQPSPQYPGTSRFISLDYSKPISDTQSSFLGTFEVPPFLQGSNNVPYTTFIDADGNITAITGDCSKGAGGIEVYHFMPETASQTGNGTWSQYQVSVSALSGDQEQEAGANWLADGMSFSPYMNSNMTDTSLYLFGGMCPSENSTNDTWTSDASYSNLMLTMDTQKSATGGQDYDISLASGRGPPIAEAGFTITGLTPTYSDENSGSPQTQQLDFVLLGGHTQWAFINMSQVALFSLPQESWTFLPVTQPSEAKGDLATRQSVTQVEPRSGHTAVLSEDGNSIVLFGGWVGDVNTPAQPQLAVLQLGAGYGGTGDWTWTIPEQSGNGLAAGSGIYGHGSTVLPGDVMMIAGGYPIATTSSRIRRDAQQPNSGFMLYNITSNTWIQTYDPPRTKGPAAGEKSTSGALTKTSQKAGLGVGLAIGVILLLGLIMFYIYYTRKMKRQREERARAILAHSTDGSFGQPFLEKGSIDGQRGELSDVDEYWRLTGRSAGTNWEAEQQQMQQSAGATGLFMNIPSPTRGLRKNLGNRQHQYHAAPRYDDNRANRGSGVIHPIAEHDDEDAIERVSIVRDDLTLSEAQRQLRDVQRVLESKRKHVSDPFRDPEAEPNPLGSHPVSPETGDTVRRVPTVMSRAISPPRRPMQWELDSMPNWTTEVPANESLLLVQSGRASPTKTDERTSSTLSERSQRSTQSSNSITRTMSTRTGNLLAAAMAARRHNNHSPEALSPEDRTSTMSTSGRKSPYHITSRPRSSTADSSAATAPPSASTDADSFTTARTNILTLQTEGSALLGGRPTWDPDDPYQRAMAAHTSIHDSAPATPYDTLIGASSLPHRKRQGFMGSLRRAIGAMGERSFSLTGSTQPPFDDRSTSTSPTKDTRPPLASAPRRAVSDGGALLRQKRGRKDWESHPVFPPYRDDPDPGDWGEPRTSLERRQAEEDWDVEDAVTKRDVQVMFSVPKTRLRVVNDDMDRASLRTASESAVSRSGSTRTGAGVSRSGSVRTLRKEASYAGLRVQGLQGDVGGLAMTAEEGGSEGFGEEVGGQGKAKAS